MSDETRSAAAALDYEARLTAVAAGFDPGFPSGRGTLNGYKAHHAIGCGSARAAAPVAVTSSFETRLALTEPIAKRLCAADGKADNWPSVARILASALDDAAFRWAIAADCATMAEPTDGPQ